MTISRNSIRIGLVIGFGMAFVAIIGMLTVFADRQIISDTVQTLLFLEIQPPALTLSVIILFGVILVAGFYAVTQIDTGDFTSLAINGALAGGILVLIMIVLVVLADLINFQADVIDMTVVFPNVDEALIEQLSFGLETVYVGYALMIVVGAATGAIGAFIRLVPATIRSAVLFSLAVVIVLGMLQDQINNIIALPDAIWLLVMVVIGYLFAYWRNRRHLITRALETAFVGLLAGLAVALIMLITSTSTGGVPDWLGNPPPQIMASLILGQGTGGMFALFALVSSALAATGAALSATSGTTHRTGITILVALLTLGVLNASDEMTLFAAIATTAIMIVSQIVMGRTSAQAQGIFVTLNARQRRTSQTLIGLAGLAFALVIPQMLTGYINNVVDLVGLFVMMGLGLNIVVGYAGLLDLGYVAFFAIGAYTTGVLTTPNFITCPPPSDNIVAVQTSALETDALALWGNGTDITTINTALNNQPLGVVTGTRSAYAALMVGRADFVEFGSVEAAAAVLSAGEIVAVVAPEGALAPLIQGNDALMTSSPFTPALEGWPARAFSAGEQSQWCTIWSFWTAWGMAVLVSGLAGVLLGIPVLGLRGDYLAIVTLGFGEIIRLVALSDVFKPFFGGAQGIVNITSPIIDLTSIAPTMADSGIPVLTQLGDALAQPISLSGPSQIYYLILFGILVTAFVSYRLSRSRLGRSWRAMREDEDVAEAMGINLVRTKLLAFSIGAGFAGIGGAIFGSYLKSIFPNSFTLIVSINVLSLIIIGGMGSIPGVFVGALVIFGLPEALREFEEYRLLMFGALLVVMMLLRPEGVIPPSTPRLEEDAEKALAEEGAAS